MGRVKTEADRAVTPQESDPEGASPRASKALTMEEEAAIKFRQEALAAFQRAVTIMAFQQMTGDADAMREQVLQILRTPAEERTEWELQRFLMWVERFDFIQKLPPSNESDVGTASPRPRRRIRVTWARPKSCHVAGGAGCCWGAGGL